MNVPVCGERELFLEYKMRSQMEMAERKVISVVFHAAARRQSTTCRVLITGDHGSLRMEQAFVRRGKGWCAN